MQIVTEDIVCLADLDQCSVPVVAQLVKEQVGYNIILLNNKLYPILEVPSTHGEFWRSTSRKILAASAKLFVLQPPREEFNNETKRAFECTIKFV